MRPVPVATATAMFNMRKADMPQGFIGLISSNIAVLISILSVLIAITPPTSRFSRRFMLTIVGFLAITAIISSLLNQYFIDKEQQSVAQNRIRLQNTIGDLLEKGEEISNTLRVGPIVDLKKKENDFLSWEKSTNEFLQVKLGKAYVIRFQSCAGLVGQALPAPNNVPDPLWAEQSNYWWTANCRTYNLKQISAQIPAAS